MPYICRNSIHWHRLCFEKRALGFAKDRKINILFKLDIFIKKIFPYFHWMHRHFWSPCIPFKYKPWCDGSNNFADYNWQMRFTPDATKGNIGWAAIKIYVFFRHFYKFLIKHKKRGMNEYLAEDIWWSLDQEIYEISAL